jgi:hypothetical protein
MPRPEEHREVADVEDVRGAEAAGERDAGDENSERRPERSSGKQTPQMKPSADYRHVGGTVRIIKAPSRTNRLYRRLRVVPITEKADGI